MLYGFDLLIQEVTGIPVHFVDDPLSCVAWEQKGLDSIEDLQGSLMT